MIGNAIRAGLLVGVMACLCLGGPCTGFGQEPARLEVTLSLDNDAYVMGQPVFFRITLRNAGSAVRGHIPPQKLERYHLEMASTKGEYRFLDYQPVETIGERPRERDFQPGDSIGDSGAILFCQARPLDDSRPLREAMLAARDYLFREPGTYRLRAVVHGEAHFGLQKPLYSNEVHFQVRPAKQGFEEFMRFAKESVSNEAALAPKAYEVSEQVLRELEGTPYQEALEWMRMDFYLNELMGEDRPRADMPEGERVQREAYRNLAEQILARPSARRMQLGATALVYLVLYHVQAMRLDKALAYAESLRAEFPWSPKSQLATAIRRTMEKQKRKQGSPA